MQPNIAKTATGLSGIAVSRKHARTITIGPGMIEVHVTGAQSGGAMDLLIFNAPAKFTGPQPHFHAAADETFHVLEGMVRFWVAGRTIDAQPGDTVHVPRGTPHAFSYPGDTPTRFIAILSPSQRMDEYFERMADLLRGRSLPPDEQLRGELRTLMIEFGQEPVAVDRA